MPLSHKRFHHSLVERAPAPAPALITSNGVVMSVVYYTAQPTFTGVIGGYNTLSADDSGSSDEQEYTSAARSQTRNGNPATSPSTRTQGPAVQSSATLGPVRPNTLSVADATANYPSTARPHGPTGVAGASSADAPADPSAETMGTGAKIGIAVGIICGIGILAAMILLLLARKKRKMKEQERVDAEKKAMSSAPVASNPAANPPDAPRLSLRPVSSLVPEFIGAKPKNRLSQGNMLGPISEGAKARNMSPSHAPAHGPGSRNGDNPFKDPENPFADPEKAAAAGYAARSPVSPLSANNVPAGPPGGEPAHNSRTSGPTAESFPLPQSQGSQSNGSRGMVPAPIQMPHGNYAELPAAAPSPVVAQGPGPETAPGNVYRILMDFRPTMEDELELRAGQLVRMLHEYDDGWALCIRLDRSQQGVVPRTCLAAKPSKPRPGPPPMGPHSSQGRPRGPPGPAGPSFGGSRGQGPPPAQAQSPPSTAPAPGAFNQPPRPLSPGPRPQPQKRSMSPGPYGASGPQPMAPVEQRRRSNSASAASVRNKRNSPPGPSKLGPGQAPMRSNSPGVAI